MTTRGFASDRLNLQYGPISLIVAIVGSRPAKVPKFCLEIMWPLEAAQVADSISSNTCLALFGGCVFSQRSTCINLWARNIVFTPRRAETTAKDIDPNTNPNLIFLIGNSISGPGKGIGRSPRAWQCQNIIKNISLGDGRYYTHQ